MKLALNGQWNDVSGVIYTYPEKYTGAGVPDWAQSLPDPREVRGLYNGDYCFTIWYNSNGFYFGCTKTNTDARNGCVMLALCTGETVPSKGKLFAEKMKALLDYCLEKNDASEIGFVDVSNKVDDIDSLMTHQALPADAFSKKPTKDLALAYRSYNNENELGLILENPYQPDCVDYKRVLLLSESCISLDSAFAQTATHIVGSIKKTYDIRSDSDDAQPSVTTVMDGERFTICYRKSGFADKTVDVWAGKSSPYCTIDGNVIRIKSAFVAGIDFMKEVVLHVVDSETQQPITKWRYRLDGGKEIIVNVDEQAIPLSPSGNHKIVVSSEGYVDRNVNIGPDDYGIKTLRLDPTDEPVFVKLQVEKKPPVEDVIRLKPNNRLYEPLKKLQKKTLQEKRSFFSLHNLVPILVVFVLAALAGAYLGRITKKDPAPISGSDSSLVAENDSLKKQIENLRSTQNSDAALDAELISCYGKVIALIKEKNEVDPSAVKSIISSYQGGLEASDKEQLRSTLEALCKELGNVSQQQQSGGGNSGKGNVIPGGNVKDTPTSKKTESQLKEEDWEYFRNNLDSWDLDKLQSQTYKKFALHIKKAEIKNMIDYNGQGVSQNYYNNANWETICMKLEGFWKENKNNDGEINSMQEKIKEYVKDNKFDLKRLAEYLK